MRKFISLFTLAIALMLAACTNFESVKGDPTATRIYTLDNGLKVYMSVNDEAPRIQTYIAVKVGGKNDPKETTGLAHYFEHLMFKGTKSFGTMDYAAEEPLLDEIERLFEIYRTTEGDAERKALYALIDSVSYQASLVAIPNEYDKLMSAIGAKGTNAYTSTDMTVYVEDIPSNQIEQWAMIQADRFQNAVIRGFHTELETVYEEKNMSLTNDYRKVSTAVAEALFPNHPYGTQTVLGTQEHLKNPSITKIKEYYKTYYVPNNMAICLSGDFDPDEMIATIEQYFGHLEPNPNLPELHFEPEAPITAPIVSDVYGLEAESIQMAWRTGGATTNDALMADIATSLLSNGKAGLLDLNLNKQQLLLSSYAYSYPRPDYGQFVVGASPKQGQSLDELRDLVLSQIEALARGDFDDELLEAIVNNYKLDYIRSIESNSSRADLYVNAFINGEPWADYVNRLDRVAAVSKEQVVAWAKDNIRTDNYVMVRKLQGKDPNEQKIEKPTITPIATNRDVQSDMLTAVQNTEVAPIEPVFVDYERDLSISEQNGLEFVYKHNNKNETFAMMYRFANLGSNNLPYAALYRDYIDYLGTPTRSAEQREKDLYTIACSAYIAVVSDQTYIIINGLNENIAQAMEIVEDWIANAEPDEAILESVKSDILKMRGDAKHNQSRAFQALVNYAKYGAEYIKEHTLSDADIKAVTSSELLAIGSELFGSEHTITYYGPSSESEVEATIAQLHPVDAPLKKVDANRQVPKTTDQSRVYLAQYDANQIQYYQYSNRGEQFDVANDAALRLYNSYFGGGMNAIVFQEMREARGLAYSASAGVSQPAYIGAPYSYYAFIATQNDKMQAAIEAFDEIIEDMPQSEKAFVIAKESILSSIRTSRSIGDRAIWSYFSDRELELTEPRDKAIFQKVQTMTLDDIVATQNEWVASRDYIYCVLGDIPTLDVNYLKTLGPVEVVTISDIFGY